MLIKVVAKVTSVGERNRYWPETGQYFESTLTIIDNPANITGTINVREKLDLGKFCAIVVNTQDSIPTSLPVSEQENAEATA